VISKSAITPSFMGRMATMLPACGPAFVWLRTDGQHVGRARLNGYNRRFAQDDSAVPHIDEELAVPGLFQIIGKQALNCANMNCLTPHSNPLGWKTSSGE